MNYLGSYKITPGQTEIEVDCYGAIQPEEKETLESSGCGRYSELLKVTTEGKHPLRTTIDITNYIPSDTWDELEFKINNPTV